MNRNLVLVLQVLLMAACSTSTKTKRTGDITKNVVTGNFAPDDYKPQITVRGVIERSPTCLVLMNDLNIKVEGPLPSHSVLTLQTPKEDGTFDFIMLAKEGKYRVSVTRKSNSSVVLDSKELEMTKSNDRFNVLFDVCRSK